MFSPEADAGRDPFQLDRLAQELESREQRSASTRKTQKYGDDDDEGIHHDLPDYVPLSHSNPYLCAPVFDVEQFLLSRSSASHTSLADLRTELRDYLATLKEELVRLINDDYEAFISLSTDLRGEGARLAKIKQPLPMLEAHVMVRNCYF
jgi:conserved oligomeric Golgi complex subunit 2